MPELHATIQLVRGLAAILYLTVMFAWMLSALGRAVFYQW